MLGKQGNNATPVGAPRTAKPVSGASSLSAADQALLNSAPPYVRGILRGVPRAQWESVLKAKRADLSGRSAWQSEQITKLREQGRKNSDPEIQKRLRYIQGTDAEYRRNGNRPLPGTLNESANFITQFITRLKVAPDQQFKPQVQRVGQPIKSPAAKASAVSARQNAKARGPKPSAPAVSYRPTTQRSVKELFRRQATGDGKQQSTQGADTRKTSRGRVRSHAQPADAKPQPQSKSERSAAGENAKGNPDREQLLQVLGPVIQVLQPVATQPQTPQFRIAKSVRALYPLDPKIEAEYHAATPARKRREFVEHKNFFLPGTRRKRGDKPGWLYSLALGWRLGNLAEDGGAVEQEYVEAVKAGEARGVHLRNDAEEMYAQRISDASTTYYLQVVKPASDAKAKRTPFDRSKIPGGWFAQHAPALGGMERPDMYADPELMALWDKFPDWLEQQQREKVPEYPTLPKNIRRMAEAMADYAKIERKHSHRLMLAMLADAMLLPTNVTGSGTVGNITLKVTAKEAAKEVIKRLPSQAKNVATHPISKSVVRWTGSQIAQTPVRYAEGAGTQAAADALLRPELTPEERVRRVNDAGLGSSAAGPLLEGVVDLSRAGVRAKINADRSNALVPAAGITPRANASVVTGPAAEPSQLPGKFQRGDQVVVSGRPDLGQLEVLEERGRTVRLRDGNGKVRKLPVDQVAPAPDAKGPRRADAPAVMGPAAEPSQLPGEFRALDGRDARPEPVATKRQQAAAAREAASQELRSAAERLRSSLTEKVLFSGVTLPPQALEAGVELVRSLVKHGLTTAQDLVAAVEEHLGQVAPIAARQILTAYDRRFGPLPGISQVTFRSKRPDLQYGDEVRWTAPDGSERHGYFLEWSVRRQQARVVNANGKMLHFHPEEFTSTGKQHPDPSTLPLRKHLTYSGTLEELIGLAQAGPGPERLELRKLSPEEVSRIRQYTGADLAGYRFVVDRNDLRHAFNKHGSGNEANLDNIPLQPDDLARIPDVLTQPDHIEMAEGVTSQGAAMIKFIKRLRGKTYVIEELRTGQGELALQTMYIEQGSKGGEGGAGHVNTSALSAKSPHDTSETNPAASSLYPSEASDVKLSAKRRDAALTREAASIEIRQAVQDLKQALGKTPLGSGAGPLQPLFDLEALDAGVRLAQGLVKYGVATAEELAAAIEEHLGQAAPQFTRAVVTEYERRFGKLSGAAAPEIGTRGAGGTGAATAAEDPLASTAGKQQAVKKVQEPSRSDPDGWSRYAGGNRDATTAELSGLGVRPPGITKVLRGEDAQGKPWRLELSLAEREEFRQVLGEEMYRAAQESIESPGWTTREPARKRKLLQAKFAEAEARAKLRFMRMRRQNRSTRGQEHLEVTEPDGRTVRFRRPTQLSPGLRDQRIAARRQFQKTHGRLPTPREANELDAYLEMKYGSLPGR